VGNGKCPYCITLESPSGGSARVVRYGAFFRISDKAKIQRLRCRDCLRTFSFATSDACFKQHKREYNKKVAELLVSGVSQRRAARILRLNRKTIVRKFLFLGSLAKEYLIALNLTYPRCETIEFDDLETSEHTKLKPLSVTLAVEHGTRRILGFRVSQMPAKGYLAKRSLKKYGFRKDLRTKGRRALFKEISPLVSQKVLIKSDENPHYPNDVRKYFPQASHQRFKGRLGAVVGQGELKKIGFDPLFSLNHTCAMLRANINRLFRKTWCTTKDPKRLTDHIYLYALFHNQNLKP
jgi:transposase-like protein